MPALEDLNKAYRSHEKTLVKKDPSAIDKLLIILEACFSLLFTWVGIAFIDCSASKLFLTFYTFSEQELSLSLQPKYHSTPTRGASAASPIVVSVSESGALQLSESIGSKNWD